MTCYVISEAILDSVCEQLIREAGVSSRINESDYDDLYDELDDKDLLKGPVGNVDLTNLDVVDDYELTHTPEAEWINRVGDDRLRRIFQMPDYLSNELNIKLMKVTNYGVNYHNYADVLNILINNIRRFGGDPSKYLNDSVTNTDFDWWYDVSSPVDIENFVKTANAFDIPFSDEAVRYMKNNVEQQSDSSYSDFDG
jgi:hypothetical protein